MDEPRFLALSRAIAVAQGPVLIPQARRLRRAVPRLPDAAKPWRGTHPGDEPALRLLVLGDSTAAGVGAATQGEALPGHLAAELHRRTRRAVTWRAVGENGATARDLLDRYLDEALADPADLVFLSVGANDALKLRSANAFRADVQALLTAISDANPHAVVLMSSLPAFVRFELLPDPLRSSLWRHSRALERAARRVIRTDERWHMSPPPPPYTEGFFASDLFHPSDAGYRDWAQFAVDDAWDAGVTEALAVRA